MYGLTSELVNATRAHDSLVVLHHPILLGTPDDLAGVASIVQKLCRGIR